eukprot:CAMPEP_0117066658 /NCGR_PEP_ID=MMETSP0472-20121206/46631_1 /TAXON_ID=693140 ORGANISM="Tiarina fusus, Strain LIS" /NCGR_SAMPLE_ID=MMETSP0472 /ASSEMBLY_ACC=CAM_ASM_000603 /LENGTH=60 /DNA_ID=CAMNT_0004787833 /DNA_START=228 /DNA_END=410 /DNA_ORIENTATION=+
MEVQIILQVQIMELQIIALALMERQINMEEEKLIMEVMELRMEALLNLSQKMQLYQNNQW